MKKNISINISGIIFHIEEDGYDKLKNYLTSISMYFSTYEDSAEIIADIENRIAELFLAKLGDTKQVISADDVDELIATMGTVSDFQAAEEGYDELPHTSARQQSKAHTHSSYSHTYTGTSGSTSTAAPQRKLYRDINRKLVGGVAAGIAHYFGVDPLWIRLLLLALTFGLFVLPPAGLIMVIAYAVMWKLLPAADDLEYDQKVKRLFRDPEKRVLGGVASGLAAYFGSDEMVIRVLFVLGAFLGGSSVLAYIVLWMITPEAKTITERMQMEGEPVTLSGIESKIKESLNMDKDAEESTLAKILLFPFRLIAMVLNGLGKLLGPIMNFLVQVLRLSMGSFFTLLSVILTFSLFAALMAFMGIHQAGGDIEGLPLAVLKNSFPFTGIFPFFLVIVIPVVSLGIAGISMLANRRMINSTIGWSLFGLWIVGIMGTIYVVPGYVKAFQAEATVDNTLTYKADAPVLSLALNANNSSDDIVRPRLLLHGYEGNQIKLVEHVESRGTNKEDAINNARMIDYKVEQQGNELVFGNGFTFKDNALFRAQKLRMELYIPYGKEFTMKGNMARVIRNSLYKHGYNMDEINDTNRWVFNEKDGLKCLNCPERELPTTLSRNEGHHEAEESWAFNKKYDFKDFDRISLGGAFYTEIRRGDAYQVILNSDEEQVNEFKIKQDGNTLKIELEGEFHNDHELKLIIVMPSLAALEAHGAHDIKLQGFNQKTMEIDFAGVIDCEGSIQVEELKGSLNGKSDLTLEGKGKVLDMELSGASSLYAFDYIAGQVKVDASGMCNAEVFVNEKLDIENTGQSDVFYKGSPKVIHGSGEFTKVEEDQE